MKQHSEHLSDAQVAHYGETGAMPAAAQLDHEVENHLAECSLCYERVLSAQRSRFALLADPPVKGSSQPAASSLDCPGEDTLRELAAGTCPPEQAVKISRHASHCDHCGPILRNYLEDFSEELGAEDQALLKSLKSSSAQHQQVLCQRMLAESAGTVSPKKRKWRWILAPAALAVCGLIAFAVWYQQRVTPQTVAKLLAQAYSEQRTMEMRIPYASHSNFHQTLSGEAGSLLSSPEALRKAADHIASELKVKPQDPAWLVLSARLDLLDWHYRAATATLDSIDDAHALDSSEVLMTRALAGYEKAEIEHDSQAYGKVVDLLGRVLQREPDNAIALFNQGLACEKLYLYECASGDYERLLKSEVDSGWIKEAREHLNRIQEKKNLAP